MSDIETFKEIKEILISQKHSAEDIALVEKLINLLKTLMMVNLEFRVNLILFTPVKLLKFLQGLEVDTHTLNCGIFA